MSKCKKREQPPLLLSLLVCRAVLIDYQTRHVTISNIVNAVHAGEFPAVCEKWSLYFEVTDLHHEVDIQIEVVEALRPGQNDKVLTTGSAQLPFKNPLEVVALAMPLPRVTFEHAGEYRVKLYAGNDPPVLLGERRIVCAQKKKGNTNG